MIRDMELFAKELEKINDWWLTDKIPLPPLLERNTLHKIIDELNDRRIIQIVGPRRAGKTTLLYQSINHLIKNNIDSKNIFYCSLDDPALCTLSDSLLKDSLDFFLENIAKDGKKFVFFDELHSSKGWYKWLKSFFDRYDDVKFIISGSSSLTLQKEANQYLRGRTFDMEIYPFSFQEFIEYKGLKISKMDFTDLKQVERIDISKLEKKVYPYFLEYLLVGGFPEWFYVNDVKKWFEKIINDIPKKAIYEDVANIFGIRSPKTLENIFAFICENQSKILTYKKINEVANLHRSILLNYIEYLKSSYMIIEIPKFAKTVKEQIKSRKKFLVVDQGIRNALLKDYEIKIENVGFIVENVVGIRVFLQGQLFYIRTNGEVDFVLRKDKTIIPIEVKYSEKPTITKAIIEFMIEHRLDHGIIVTKNVFKQERRDNKTFYFIPAWLFVLIEL